ncbi:hypothetical protein DASC09_048680 [Saccharomycopsis crataegensis]|uniref:Phosphatidylinositol N-acetylglucosaminyltransferase subunit H conserved domain-containing protein n=1 Tax=Saccharomycopsis crataegensis TaxID=43959 RepID=A0AAV5QTT2_9ASCO|nr:hypothetical protein DASC09_048680 [Saccharomycopsis crataegensis]
MTSSKDYILKAWPPNDTIANTKKYRIVKKSPIPVSVKILTVSVLVFAALYIVVVRCYLVQVPFLSYAQSHFASPKSAGLTILVTVAINHLLCYVFQSDFEESIMVIKSMGIEISTTIPNSTFFGRAKIVDRFIPIGDIIDIMIHEAFKGFEVIFYMVILRQNQKKLTIVFEKLLPRRDQLEVVLRGCRKVLYHQRRDNKLEIPGWTKLSEPNNKTI